MIQSIDTKLDHIPERKLTSPHNVLILLFISIAAILVSALPGSPAASADSCHLSNFCASFVSA